MIRRTRGSRPLLSAPALVPASPLENRLGRRSFVAGALSTVAGALVLGACDEGSSVVSSSSGDAGSSSGSDAGSSNGSATAWATGGTAAMIAKASYPDPFASVTATSCTLTCQATLGPCHTGSVLRSDVSDGKNGVPVRLLLRILDASCTPVSGAFVEIWHTDYRGIYSGNISNMCNTAAEDKAASFMRGYQVTDSNGVVAFDTCFPGWYSSRLVHIHFRIQKGSYQSADNASSWVVSQLLFADTVVQDLFSNVSLYSTYGIPDTLIAQHDDTVFGSTSDVSPYVCDVQRTSDGAMLASKTLVLRESTATSLCGV